MVVQYTVTLSVAATGSVIKWEINDDVAHMTTRATIVFVKSRFTV